MLRIEKKGINVGKRQIFLMKDPEILTQAKNQLGKCFHNLYNFEALILK